MMQQRIRTFLSVISCLSILAIVANVQASDAIDNAKRAAGDATFQVMEGVAAKVNLNNVVHSTTGVNPDDYPCAKAGLIALYENRKAISDLSIFHPKRLFTWVAETMTYFSIKVMNFFKRLMDPSTVTNGIREIQSMARSGDPFKAVERKFDGWFAQLNPRSKFVLHRKANSIIKNSTNADGSCKPGK